MCARRDRASWPGCVAGQSARTITAAGQPSWRQPRCRPAALQASRVAGQPRRRPAALQASRVAGQPRRRPPARGGPTIYERPATWEPGVYSRATPGGWPAWRSHWLKLPPMRATPGGWPASRAHGLQGTLLRVALLYTIAQRATGALSLCVRRL